MILIGFMQNALDRIIWRKLKQDTLSINFITYPDLFNIKINSDDSLLFFLIINVNDKIVIWFTPLLNMMDKNTVDKNTPGLITQATREPLLL